MLLKLSPTSRENFVFLGDYVFTFEDQSMQEVDVLNLNPELQKELLNNLLIGTLVRSKRENSRDMAELKALKSLLPKEEEKKEVQTPRVQVEMPRNMLSDEELKYILRSKISQIKEAIEGMRQSELNRLYTLENERKRPRKTVVVLLEEKIAAANNDVAMSIEQEKTLVTRQDILDKVKSLSGAGVIELEDIPEKTIEIRLPNKEVLNE